MGLLRSAALLVGAALLACAPRSCGPGPTGDTDLLEGIFEPGRVSAAKTSDARAEALRGNEY